MVSFYGTLFYFDDFIIHKMRGDTMGCDGAERIQNWGREPGSNPGSLGGNLVVPAFISFSGT